MITVRDFKCMILQDQMQRIQNNFNNFDSPRPYPEKALYKKELDYVIPRFLKYFDTFSPALQHDSEVQQMHLEVSRIQDALSMNLSSTTDNPSDKTRL